MSDSSKPRVLIIHNRYRQPGGEDVVADAQAMLLIARGHEVRIYEKNNSEINSYTLAQKARLFFQTPHNPKTAREVAALVEEFKPAVAHVHNTLPLISPSVYKPLNDAGVKVIQWLHNYRLICPAGTLYRDNAPCTLCLKDHSFAPAIQYRCWSNSKMATRALVRMLKSARREKLWARRVDLFVALNSYQKNILAEHEGIPPEKIVVQPNFHDAQALKPRKGNEAPKEFLFVGRLSTEKGIRTLIKAVKQLPEISIAIAGDGPLREEVRRACAGSHVCLGSMPRDELLERLAHARALLFTSEWPEGCPTVILEALACGVPVVASRVPGAVELLSEDKNALFFDPGDADGLANCVRRLNADSNLQSALGQNAREAYLQRFTVEAGYRNLMEMYERMGIVQM